jgi:type III secretion system low calcium response chaperone LcrH/SycD
MAAVTQTVPQERLAEQTGKWLMSGGTIGGIYNYDKRDYEALYAMGHSLYSQARYPDAVKAFGFLVMHNHLERRFLVAFAASLQMVRDYETAINYYALATAMDMTDLAPSFHVCECLLAQGKVQEAREGLEMIVAQCEGEAQAALKQRAQGLLAVLPGSGSRQ